MYVQVETVVHAKLTRAHVVTRVGELAARNAPAALVAAVVSLIFGLYQLGQPSLWVDEAVTAHAVTLPYDRHFDGRYWFYYSLIKPWTTWAGTSEFALRFPSVVAAAAACAALVPLGNRLLRPPVGSIAGVVLALNAFVVQWSQQARDYTIVMLLAIVSTWALLELRERRTLRAWAGYTIVLVVSIVFQPLSAGLLAAAQLLAARGFRTKVVMAGIAGVLLTSVFLAGVVISEPSNGPLLWNTAPTAASVTHVILELSGPIGIGLGLALVGLAVVDRERLLLGCWAFAPLLLSIAVTPIGAILVDRYLIVSAPAFALLTAAALVRLPGWWRAGATLAFSMVAAIGLIHWYSPDGSQNWQGEDWKAATRFAMERGGAWPASTWAYRYYGGVVRDTGLYIVWGYGDHVFAGSWPLDVSFGEHLRVQRRGPAR